MRRRIGICLLFLGLNGCIPSSLTPAGTKGTGIRIATAHDPQTLDPRLIRDLPTTTILHMLFEGLMRSGFHGHTSPGVAEKVVISEDQRIYTFTLRDTKWSNGDTLTAKDFEKTWLSLLDPKFAAPNAYQLYVIKGAKERKENNASEKDVGIRALDDKTLVVELKEPTPYFLELTTTDFYFPVHASMRDNPALPSIVGNGPFKLENWKRNSEIEVVRNSNYWDASVVNFDSIQIVVVGEHAAMQMFKNGELDWVGSPMSDIPQDAIQTLKEDDELRFAPAAGTHWFKFNIAKAPFNNEKLRKAFAYAIDRKSIVEHITQGEQIPATGIVPPVLGLTQTSYFEDHNTTIAWDLFQEALIEMNLEIETLPPISLCYKAGDRNHKLVQAVQQQWKKNFGIEVSLEACEYKSLVDKMARGNFQITAGSWFADFADPINFLEVFKYKSTPTNGTGWENENYIAFLNHSATAATPQERVKFLELAQAELMDQMPVAPLFYSMFNYVKDITLYGVYFSELGYLDFKNAYYDSLEVAD